MIVLIIIVSYLLIGAILAWKNTDVCEEATQDMLGEFHQAYPQKVIVTVMMILTILLLPIFELGYIISTLILKIKSLKR